MQRGRGKKLTFTNLVLRSFQLAKLCNQTYAVGASLLPTSYIWWIPLWQPSLLISPDSIYAEPCSKLLAKLDKLILTLSSVPFLHLGKKFYVSFKTHSQLGFLSEPSLNIRPGLYSSFKSHTLNTCIACCVFLLQFARCFKLQTKYYLYFFQQCLHSFWPIVCLVTQLSLTLWMQPHGSQPARLLCPWRFSR